MDFATISLQQLRYIRAIADGSTYSEAADALYVSQSALSQGLAKLEEEAGISLFEADGRRRRLTDAGNEVAAVAARILSEADRLAGDLQLRAEGRRGKLHVAMIDAAALYLGPAAVSGFRDRLPEVEVVITVSGSDACLERLAAFEADVAVVVGPAEGFTSTEMAREKLSAYGPKATPPDDAPWVLYPAGSHTRDLIDRGLAELGVVPRVVGESGNPAVLRQLAVLNGAWTVLPAAVAHAFDQDLRRGRLVCTRPIVVAERPAAPANAIRQQFVRSLTSEESLIGTS